MFILEIQKSKSGYFFHIKSRNGQIISHSEIYKNRSYCRKLVKKIADTINWTIKDHA